MDNKQEFREAVDEMGRIQLKRVTLEAAAPADPVTPPTWKDVMGDCIQARQEVLGVLAGLDPGVPPPVRFSQTEAYIGASIVYLRKSVSALDEAIKEIQSEMPVKAT